MLNIIPITYELIKDCKSVDDLKGSIQSNYSWEPCDFPTIHFYSGHTDIVNIEYRTNKYSIRYYNIYDVCADDLNLL